MKNALVVAIGLLILFALQIPSKVTVGTFEKYEVLSSDPGSFPSNYVKTTDMPAHVKIYKLGNYTIMIGSSEAVYFHNCTMVPKTSAKYVPHYNESVYLPADLKKEIRQQTNDTSTYYETVVRTAWIIQNYIDYDPYASPDNDTHAVKNGVLWIIPEKEFPHVIDNIIRYDRRGSCRHESLLLYQALKYMGIRARFVSGFAITNYNVESSEIGTVIFLRSFHEWIQYYDPDAGWINIDPTFMTTTKPFPCSDFPALVLQGGYAYQADKLFPPIRQVEKRQKTGEIWVFHMGSKTLVYTRGTGIVVYSRGKIYYVPEKTLAILPRDAQFTYKDKVHPSLPPLYAFFGNRMKIP